jgi:hypothetical protein
MFVTLSMFEPHKDAECTTRKAALTSPNFLIYTLFVCGIPLSISTFCLAESRSAIIRELMYLASGIWFYQAQVKAKIKAIIGFQSLKSRICIISPF